MTEDYKEYVLKYITGNLEQESSIVEPQFKNVQSVNNNLYNQIKAYFSSRVVYVDFVPSKNNKNQELNYSVLACRGQLIGESEESGAYVILDKEYNIIDIITHYSDGSLIGATYCLNVDDKGNYYAVEYSGSNYRIVLMNNLVLKPINSNTYEAIIIDKHNIPNQYSWESMIKVFKNDGNNKYFVVGNRNNNAGIVGCELEIGDTDTWTYYTSSYTKANAYAIFDNGYNVYWDSEGKVQFQIAVNNYGLILLSKGTSSNMIQTQYIVDEIPPNSQGNFIFYTNEIGYYSTSETINNLTAYTIYKVNLQNKSSSIIYYAEAPQSNYNNIWLFKNSNSIYYFKIEYNSGTDYNLYFGLIDDFIYYEKDLGTFSAESFLQAFCYPNVITEFNKNYVYIQNQNTLFSLDFIWNKNNYNGEPYISSASLIPNIITIEDENEDEIFNRNIYNLSSYSNWYTASVQIPNYFLNNETLYNALLYSKGNNILTTKNINLTKNIYEELNINFVNSFVVIDDEKENIYTASDILSSMLDRITNAYIGKFVINYADNTTQTKSITTSELTYSNLKTTLKFMIYTNKKINSIDLISENEAIYYKTIDCSNLELNKYYLISQDIRIE